MSPPDNSAAEHWRVIVDAPALRHRPRTHQEWAQIADAIQTADSLRPNAERGAEAWCRVAVDTFTRLHHAGAHANLRPGDAPYWPADEHIIRTWLNAPTGAPHGQPDTMLEERGWQHTFGPHRRPDAADLSILVDFAQEVGVVGTATHKANLLRWIQDRAVDRDRFLLLVWRPDGPALTSEAIHTEQLVPNRPSASDRIVGILSTVADVARELLSPVARDPSDPRARPSSPSKSDADPVVHLGGRGNAFPPPSGRIETAQTPEPLPPSTQSGPPRRTRT